MVQHDDVRVCHISPVHDVVDNRVFLKECCSLQAAGYDVHWVVPHDRDEEIQGVHVVALKKRSKLVSRWLFAGWESFRAALKTRAKIYHFHDPEFIPFGLLLRILGHRVVYDIHEDYVSAISQKSYIPAVLRWGLSRFAGLLESLSARAFEQVIAERYYEERFPRAVKVLNYPRILDSKVVDPKDLEPKDPSDIDSEASRSCRRSASRLLYTGKVHIYRGALIHGRLPGLVDNTTVSFIGRCRSKLKQRILAESPAPEKLEFTGIDQFVPFTEIIRQYEEGEWLAGLALFPPNEHLDRKELTKLFEYMQYGLPILASNFPVWRRLVEDNGCGICVDPENDAEIQQGIERLIQDEDFWHACSRNGRAAVREKFSWQSQSEVLIELYERLSR